MREIYVHFIKFNLRRKGQSAMSSYRVEILVVET